MASSAAISLDALRQRIRELEGPQVQVQSIPSGVSILDELVGGLPRPGLVELVGPEGSGRTWLALRLVAAHQAGHQPAAWVDFEHRLHPPAAQALGVRLDRLLVVRPPADRAAWAMEQLLRSGCFSLVVGADPGGVGRSGARWSLATEAGASTGVILRQRTGRDLPVHLRLSTGQEQLVVLRQRGALAGRSVPLGRSLPDAA